MSDSMVCAPGPGEDFALVRSSTDDDVFYAVSMSLEKPNCECVPGRQSMAVCKHSAKVMMLLHKIAPAIIVQKFGTFCGTGHFGSASLTQEHQENPEALAHRRQTQASVTTTVEPRVVSWDTFLSSFVPQFEAIAARVEQKDLVTLQQHASFEMQRVLHQLEAITLQADLSKGYGDARLVAREDGLGFSLKRLQPLCESNGRRTNSHKRTAADVINNDGISGAENVDPVNAFIPPKRKIQPKTIQGQLAQACAKRN